MKNETKSLVSFIIIGLPAGIISYYIRNNFAALIFAIIILYATSEVLKKILKINEKFNWFLKNGGWIYIFIWFITWIIFYNLHGL